MLTKHQRELKKEIMSVLGEFGITDARITQNGGKHPKLKVYIGNRSTSIPIASSPSDRRALENIKKDVRNRIRYIGVQTVKERQKPKEDTHHFGRVYINRTTRMLFFRANSSTIPEGRYEIRRRGSDLILNPDEKHGHKTRKSYKQHEVSASVKVVANSITIPENLFSHEFDVKKEESSIIFVNAAKKIDEAVAEEFKEAFRSKAKDQAAPETPSEPKTSVSEEQTQAQKKEISPVKTLSKSPGQRNRKKELFDKSQKAQESDEVSKITDLKIALGLVNDFVESNEIELFLDEEGRVRAQYTVTV